jgi:site-specific DNA recombinase
MRVVALFRVSTEKQATDGASLDAQERAYRAMAARDGWTTVQEFRGCESASQASSDRRVLQQVLACIRDTEPDAIWVYEQSRLTRGDELEVAGLLRELREREIKILVNGVVRDLGSIDERFMVGIQSLVDRAESERIKERMHRGKRERARQGKKNSGPSPYGYQNPLKGMPGYGTLEIVEEEARVVRLIFNERLEGSGEKAIANLLNERGVPSPLGGQWGGSTIRRVLLNPVCIGVSASNVWVSEKGKKSFRLDLKNERAIVVENAHPAIIDRATWDAVHGMPKQPRAAVPRMLTGLLYINGHLAGGDSDCRKRFYSTANHGTGSAVARGEAGRGRRLGRLRIAGDGTGVRRAPDAAGQQRPRAGDRRPRDRAP